MEEIVSGMDRSDARCQCSEVWPVILHGGYRQELLQ